uniref:Uncharacterized protein n=1 Tax=Cacopsylla melanoneura TaxID=428564 RepID=A0A8D8T005_9HEMI
MACTFLTLCLLAYLKDTQHKLSWKGCTDRDTIEGPDGATSDYVYPANLFDEPTVNWETYTLDPEEMNEILGIDTNTTTQYPATTRSHEPHTWSYESHPYESHTWGPYKSHTWKPYESRTSDSLERHINATTLNAQGSHHMHESHRTFNQAHESHTHLNTNETHPNDWKPDEESHIPLKVPHESRTTLKTDAVHKIKANEFHTMKAHEFQSLKENEYHTLRTHESHTTLKAKKSRTRKPRRRQT